MWLEIPQWPMGYNCLWIEIPIYNLLHGLMDIFLIHSIIKTKMEGKISMFMMKSSLFQNLYNPIGDQLSNLYSTGSAGGISTRCQQKFVERFSSSAV